MAAAVTLTFIRETPYFWRCNNMVLILYKSMPNVPLICNRVIISIVKEWAQPWITSFPYFVLKTAIFGGRLLRW